jgi:phosphoribosylglycinamide formyltransferase 2
VRAANEKGEIETHYCAPVGHIQKNGDYVESWQPQPMSGIALEKSRAIAEKVTSALGGRGVFGVELFIKGDNVYFSEVSPRPHDTGLVTLITQWQSEFALHARAILGLPVDASLRCEGASAVIYGEMNESAIVFDGLEKALSVPLTDIRLFGKPESFINRRMGVVISGGGSVDEARGRARLAASLIEPRKIS